MNATKLIAIVFAALGILIGGCSKDNRVMGPGNDAYPDIDKDLVELTTPAENQNNAAMIASVSSEDKIERVGFEATVKKSGVEGGCWYLATEKGLNYTPYFDAGSPKLYEGLQLFVYGYIDENMNSYCMTGPVFCIEKYKNLWRDNEPKTSDARENSAKTAAKSATSGRTTYSTADGEEQANSHLTELKGFYGSTDEGCFYLYDDGGIIVELYFVQHICPDIQKGSFIMVKGEYSLLTWSPCMLATLFNVEEFRVMGDKNVAAKEGHNAW